MPRITRAVTKIALLLLFAFSVFAEAVILPLAASEALAGIHSNAYLFPLIVVWGALIALCGQVMIVITWRLVSFAGDERIFTDKPLGLVTILTISPFIAAGLFVASFMALNILGLTPPIIMYGLIGSIALSAAMGLILVAMRSLLLRAITLSTELAQVV